MARGKADSRRRIHDVCRLLNVEVKNGRDESALIIAGTIAKRRTSTAAHVNVALTPETQLFL